VVNTTSPAKNQQSQETRRRGCNVSPSLLSAGGTRRPKVLGEDDGPTVVVWEGLSESEQEQWSKRLASRTIGWFGAGREKKRKSNARLKSMEKKSSQTASSTPNPKQDKRRIRKEAKSSQCAGKRGGDRATSNVQ